MSGRSFNLYFTLLPPVHECFPKKSENCLSHSVIKSESASVRGSFRVFPLMLERGGSGGTSFCIPLLNEIRAFGSEDGSKILLSNLVVYFDIGWSTVQRSFCTQLFGIELYTDFCARVVSFLSITLVLGVRVETFLHLIFV